MNKETLRIVYMGTPEFAVAPLRALVENRYQVVAVVTMPDKPVGRGMKIQPSAVKQYALEAGLPVLQPQRLKDEAFLQELRSFRADLQIVVAFRMLPQVVWQMPPMGTFNLHASLLPQYRGAAPIHWAVINGESETGVTTFLLQHEIDTGNILLQERISIGPDETTGSVHDRLMALGAELVPRTVDLLLSGRWQAVPQQQLLPAGGVLHTAPKLFKDNTRIDWRQTCTAVCNFVRGLNPYPTAWTKLLLRQGNKTSVLPLKVFDVRGECSTVHLLPGTVETDGRHYLKVAVADGWVWIERLQPAGKKAMTAGDFLHGFQQLPVFSLD
ncbi:MAG: methionyl-tRNA formyltransferase [Bacteroidales bacterium]|nr:methionyl-tRNA formyltransferase [Bacteroidales bacterium]